MDGEIDQNYLHATGGTGFYFVLPLAGEKGERTYGVHSTCGYGAATMYTEVSKRMTGLIQDARSCCTVYETRSIEKAPWVAIGSARGYRKG